MGIGRVESVCYSDKNKISLSRKKAYNKNATEKSFSYIRDVDWDSSFPPDGIIIPRQGDWTKAVKRLEGTKLKKIFKYLKKSGYNLDNFLKQSPKGLTESGALKFPDPKTIRPKYIKNKIISHIPQKGSKSKGKKPVKIESKSEEHKKEIGEQGELIVYESEKRRLIKTKRPDLAKKIERISLKDDSAGYDILSFRKDGSKKYIEVKSTKARFNGKNTEFEITATEVNASKMYGDDYYIYRVFDVMSTSPTIKIIKSPYGMRLEPKSYIATIYFE